MRLVLSTLVLMSLVACAMPDGATTADTLPLEASTPYARWVGDFVATEDQGGDAFQGKVRGLSLQVDPAHPEAGGDYAVYYRWGRLEVGTFAWSGHVQNTRASVTLTPDPKSSTWVRTVSLKRAAGKHTIGTDGLDFKDDPTGEARDTTLEPLLDGECLEHSCTGADHCEATAFVPNDPKLRHACLMDARQLVPFDLP